MRVPVIKVILFATLCAFSHAERELPAEAIVSTEPIAADLFQTRVEKDPRKYSGTYAGEVGGDSGGFLEVKIQKAEAEGYPAFTAGGKFEVKPVGSEAVAVNFENAGLDHESGECKVDAGAFRIFFVRLGDQSGVVVGDIFLLKE